MTVLHYCPALGPAPSKLPQGAGVWIYMLAYKLLKGQNLIFPLTFRAWQMRGASFSHHPHNFTSSTIPCSPIWTIRVSPSSYTRSPEELTQTHSVVLCGWNQGVPQMGPNVCVLLPQGQLILTQTKVSPDSDLRKVLPSTPKLSPTYD